MPVYLLATLDTKGPEAAFVRDLLTELGVETRLVDTGCLSEPSVPADVSRAEVFAAAGTSLREMQDLGDRGAAVTKAADDARTLIRTLFDERQVDGVMALGGSAGTTIGTAAMRALPLGVPKVMVSTLASGQTRPYVGGRDIVMLNSVVDISGINRISRAVLSQAACAMAGMVTLKPSPQDGSGHERDRPLIAATMFGVTTPCVQHAQTTLDEAGYEVLVFHATGNGGEAMEGLIADGLIAGVLDLTTTELADELVGGVLSAGPTRLTAAGRQGVPQVISVGATDMVNFGPRATVPERFADRRFHVHNANVTLMRTTVEENRRLGGEIARKAAASLGATAILLPLQGVSAIDKLGEPFDDPAARDALFEAIRENRGGAELLELDLHINDFAFADAAAKTLLEMLGKA
ncbi:MAG: Tm-1-like ATP-binding domain-containing protein [Planctomycetaceae bacterium]